MSGWAGGKESGRKYSIRHLQKVYLYHYITDYKYVSLYQTLPTLFHSRIPVPHISFVFECLFQGDPLFFCFFVFLLTMSQPVRPSGKMDYKGIRYACLTPCERTARLILTWGQSRLLFLVRRCISTLIHDQCLSFICRDQYNSFSPFIHYFLD